MSQNNSELLNLSSKEKREFFNSLFVYYKSGIPIVDSMKKISEKSHSAGVNYVAKLIYKDLSRGNSFDNVIRKYENVFGRVVTGLLISGEQSGKLPVVLARIQTLLQKENHIKNKVISAMVYPSIILFMSVFIICLFMFFVFPMMDTTKKADIFSQAISAVIKTGIVFAILGGIIFYLRKIHFAEKKLVPFLTSLPKVGEIVKSANLANFFLVMYTAYDSGLPATLMLELASETVKEKETKQKLKLSIKHIIGGKDISTALAMTEAIPENYVAAIATGETTGELDKALLNITEEIDESTELAISAFSQTIQPVMLILAGVVVVILLANMYGNLYKNFLGNF